jgi:AcrR family transcriptional regulator
MAPPPSPGSAALLALTLPELLDARPSKSNRARVRILDATIACFGSAGLEAVTYDAVARQAGLSRSLVMRYFPSYEVLFEKTMVYVRGFFQAYAVRAIQAAGPRSRDQLEAYLRSMFAYVREHRAHMVTWLHFFYVAGSRRKWRNLNTQLAELGHQRIQAMIELGRAEGDFPAQRSPRESAKLIQMLISGALTSACAERMPEELSSRVEEEFVARCLELAGAPPGSRSSSGSSPPPTA